VWPQTYRGGNKLEPGARTLFSELKRAGYTNGFVGKWHMTPDDLVLPERPPQYVPPEVRSDIDWFAGHEHWHRYYEDGVYFLNDDETRRSAGDYEPANQVRLAKQFINTQVKRKSSFFCTLSVGIPHNPYDSQGWATEPISIVLRENVPPASRREARLVLSEYYGMVSRFDVTFQDLLDHLSNLGVLDDTIVIVTSDHGDMLYSQGERLKRKPWEESLRVPFAIRWPAGGIRAGSTSDALMASIDVMPTLLGLLALPLPSGLEGIDHSGLMFGRPFTPRDSIYIGISHPNEATPFETEWRGVRTADGWTYATSLARPDWLLYDNDADPMQRVNLIHDPAHAAKAAELEALTRRWAEEIGDPYPFPER
jgi:arylsulfatase A-like enzyme